GAHSNSSGASFGRRRVMLENGPHSRILTRKFFHAAFFPRSNSSQINITTATIRGRRAQFYARICSFTFMKFCPAATSGLAFLPSFLLHTGYRGISMGPERVRVTFSHQYGFVAYADWLPPQGICASSINALRARVERARPRASMEFTMELDPAAKARHGTQIALRATNRRQPAVSLAPVGGG